MQPSPHLLLFDIGNTSIKVGLARPEGMATTYTLRTDAGQTADSLGLTLATLLSHACVPPEAVHVCVCSSVVPGMTPIVRDACRRFVGRDILLVPHDIPVPLENRYSKPSEVGADRLVGAFAARRLCPEPTSIIAVDFGTATTFDCISGEAYLGGLIFPGVHTAAAALSANAAKLPRVSLEVSDLEPVPGRDTVSSIQHGIVFGFACMVEGLTARLAAQIQKETPGDVRVVATGGFASDIARVTRCFDLIFPDLLLDGLRRLYVEYDNNKSGVAP